MGITQERLKELFTYDSSGTFIRKIKSKLITANKGTKRYLRLFVDGKDYSLHRLIFLYHYGYLPKQIDHMDNDRFNNRIENLRESTQQHNCLNRTHHKNSKNKYKNFYKVSGSNSYCVQIIVNGKRKYFGSYKNIEEANKIAISLREKYHGEFANNGRILS